MVDWWQNTPVTKPSVKKKTPDEELHESFIPNKEKPCCIQSFLCHTQAVERTKKLVIEVSSSVIEERDSFIRAKMEGRKRLPAFETKRLQTAK